MESERPIRDDQEIQHQELHEPLIKESENLVSHKVTDMLLASFKLGLLDYEELRRGDSSLKKYEIWKLNILQESQFSYLRDLIYNTPGHYRTKLLFSTLILKTDSIIYSLIGIILYYVPSLLIIIGILLLDRNYFQSYSRHEVSPHGSFYLYCLTIFFKGVSQTVLAMMISNGCLLFKRKSYDVFNVVLVSAAFILDNYSYSFRTMAGIMIIFGIINIFKGESDTTKIKPYTGIYKTANLPFLGKPALLTFIFLFISLFSYVEFYGDKCINLFLLAVNYRVGTFTAAGGLSMIPLFITEYSEKLTQSELLRALGIASFIPGPIMSFSAYAGGLINGVLSALISVIFINLPALLLLMAAMPYPDKFKYNSCFRNFLIGVNLASIGFIFSAAYKLFQEICLSNDYINSSYSTLNVIICFILLYERNIKVPLVLLIGGSITIIYSIMSNLRL